ncbi:MAG: ACP S-malonyltransferase [Candidatus Eremiobacteraeota bacterium]|nr:ACP S-malonyltransferase [Candidatus Eremiobacteraeota bacterium]MBC5803669.1 ACP S-malonyltransferase [Candidatus Eremiobacteraeota bacterium]MBC5821496.1 ACP S-malonyltransferase [Candidatus Eremiobacteraeota bacterium]
MTRVGVVFPGQGSQSVGMGGALAERFPVVADLFARARRVLGYDLGAVVRNGPEEALRETRYSQPAIFVVNYALAAAAGDALTTVASAGHSFGEYCSLTLASALTFEDALALVQERAMAMQAAAETAPGAMAAILGLDVARIREAVAEARDTGRVQLANFNAPAQIVISGDRDAVARAGELALTAGAKRVVPLNVSGAWHSALMAPARERFAPFVARATIALPKFAVISNVDAQPYRDVASIRRNLVRSVTEEVLWHAASERLLGERLDLVVEFGGSPVLGPLMKRLPNAPPTMHVGDDKAVVALADRLTEGAA